MSEETEDNKFNFYQHLDNIKDSIEWLKTIHVYDLSERSRNTNLINDLKIKLDESEKQCYAYELELYQAGLEMQNCKSDNCYLKHQLEIKEKEVELLKSADEYVSEVVEKYNKIPRFVKWLFGAN